MSPSQKVLLSSKWLKSPAKPEERMFALPAGETVGAIVLYTWTIDGRPAENRFEKLELVGPAGCRPSTCTTCRPAGPCKQGSTCGEQWQRFAIRTKP